MQSASMATENRDLVITWDSTREEVLAAVEEHEARVAAAMRKMDEVEFPEVPEGFVGCVWSKCGTVRAHYRPTQVNPSLEAQKRAGEEDQSAEGWEGA